MTYTKLARIESPNKAYYADVLKPDGNGPYLARYVGPNGYEERQQHEGNEIGVREAVFRTLADLESR